MALLHNQHTWMKWLDGPTDFARVLSFDIYIVFDSVSHYGTLVAEKIKSLPGINPHVINWVVTFYTNCDFCNYTKSRALSGSLSRIISR